MSGAGHSASHIAADANGNRFGQRELEVGEETGDGLDFGEGDLGIFGEAFEGRALEVPEFLLDAVEFGDDDWVIKRVRGSHRGSERITARNWGIRRIKLESGQIEIVGRGSGGSRKLWAQSLA